MHFDRTPYNGHKKLTVQRMEKICILWTPCIYVPLALDWTTRRKYVLRTETKPRSSGPHLDAVLGRLWDGAISKVRMANQQLEFWNGPQRSVRHFTLRRNDVTPTALKDANISTFPHFQTPQPLVPFLIILSFRPPLVINIFSVNFYPST